MNRTFIPKRLKNPMCWGSLVLNVILVAILLIGPHRLLPGFHPPKPGPVGFIRHMSRDLSEADRAIFEKIWSQHRAQLEQAGVKVDAQMIQIAQIVKQQPFSLEELKTSHDLFDQTKREMGREIADFLFDLLPALSEEGRQNLQIAPPHLQEK